LNGHEWLLVHQPKIWKEIEDVISRVDAHKFKTKISKEKGMRGKRLYAPKRLNKRFKSEFRKAYWEESRTNYWVTDDYELIRKTLHLSASEQKKQIIAAGHRAISSYNQTDFVKNRVAVELQFGKYSFIAYDLFVKHLAFFVGNAIDVGIDTTHEIDATRNVFGSRLLRRGSLRHGASGSRGACGPVGFGRRRALKFMNPRS
jgi:hypothetical protein